MLAHIFKKPSWRITHPDALLLDLDEVEATEAGATDLAATPALITKKAS
jgi:hypothetical protein